MNWLGRSLLLAAFVVGVPALASAQTTVQGQIIIQEAQPSQQPVVTQQAYPPQSAYVAPQPVVCPEGTFSQVDAYGRTVCMQEIHRHRVSGGLLGGGIGLFVGGWVVTGFSGLVVGVFGATGCAISSSISSGSCVWTSDSASNFLTFSWIPLIGPWVSMGYMWPGADAGMYAWIAIEGLIQAGGLTMLIFGALGEDYVDYQPIAGVDFHVRPMFGTTNGVEATLHF